MIRKPLLGAILVVALGSIAFVAGACGDDDKSTASTASVTPAAPAVVDADVATAIDYLDKAGLHDIDTAVNTTGKIPATAQTVALHAQIVVLTTNWPTELQDDAATMAGIFGDMVKSLDPATPDIKVVGAASTKAHEGEHDFSQAVWDYLAKQANVKTTNASTSP